jgi:hypothetical protein
VRWHLWFDALGPAVGLVEREGLGDAFELDGSERVEPHLGAGVLPRLLAHHHLSGVPIGCDASRQVDGPSVDISVL